MSADKSYYYKNIMVTVTSVHQDYVAFTWIDTKTMARTQIPPSSKFPWNEIQPGVSYAVLTRTPLQNEYNSASRLKVWDWVSAYPLDINNGIHGE